MRSNEDIQAAFITYLKAQTTITALLSDVHEIREDQWQGTNFVYPCVRFDLRRNQPNMGERDCPNRINASVLCYSENASSQEADNLAGVVATTLHQKAFTRNGIRFSGTWVTELVPAIRQDERTWRSQVVFQAIVE